MKKIITFLLLILTLIACSPRTIESKQARLKEKYSPDKKPSSSRKDNQIGISLVILFGIVMFITTDDNN